MDDLTPVTISEVQNILGSMPSKSSPLDYLPTSLLKSCSSVFAPIICTLANLSFSEGHFPDSFKSAQISPLLKKPGLDEDSPASYRPISNLNTVSKILEKLFSSRLKQHVKFSSNTNLFQSAYRQFHSTETALLKILGDVYTAVDGKKITIMVSLDLSAAFDTLNHSTMLHRLKHTFGISGSALLWISTYLEHRSFYVKVDDASSEVFSSDIAIILVFHRDRCWDRFFSLCTSHLCQTSSNHMAFPTISMQTIRNCTLAARLKILRVHFTSSTSAQQH